MMILYDYLKNDYDITVRRKHGTGCIAGLFGNPQSGSLLNRHHPNARLSIVVPVDTYYICKSVCYETALYDQGGGRNGSPLIYNGELGYSDICRFDTPNDVSQEIVRICVNNSK